MSLETLLINLQPEANPLEKGNKSFPEPVTDNGQIMLQKWKL